MALKKRKTAKPKSRRPAAKAKAGKKAVRAKKPAARKPAAKKVVAKKKAAQKKTSGGKARTLIVLFNLRKGVSAAAYERWARQTDIPVAGGLKAVKDFKVYRAEGIFGSGATPPYKYFEILHVTGLDALVSDIGKEPRMKNVAAAFQKFADNPIFIVTEKFAG